MNNIRLPDFIIAGAMKCGTTTLRHILSAHPDIFIPTRELFFFDIDDFQQHSDFFVHEDNRWWDKDYEGNLDKYLAWYRSFFEGAEKGQLVGEDSTTYIASTKAPERIRKLLPDIKIILMFRDPASRSYSHYWHRFRTGRVVCSFEDSLRFSPENIIERSLYKKQVERFLSFFPKENILFILFEEFFSDLSNSVEQVCDFLGIPMDIDIESANIHANPARIPRNITVQLWRNRLLRGFAERRFIERLPDMPLSQQKGLRFHLGKLLSGLHRYANPVRTARPPSMRPETRRFLNEYFARENDGLAELIDKDVERHWYR